ncbi:putative alpha/beta hydrolase, partial [Mycobacterium kansasii]
SDLKHPKPTKPHVKARITYPDGRNFGLEGQLQQLDDEIGRAVELERNHQLTAADIAALDAFIHTCEQDAIDDTQTALAELHSIRDGYSNSLRTAEKNLAVD